MKTLTFRDLLTLTKTAFRAKSQSVDLFLLFISLRVPYSSSPSAFSSTWFPPEHALIIQFSSPMSARFPPFLPLPLRLFNYHGNR